MQKVSKNHQKNREIMGFKFLMTNKFTSYYHTVELVQYGTIHY